MAEIAIGQRAKMRKVGRVKIKLAISFYRFLESRKFSKSYSQMAEIAIGQNKDEEGRMGKI